MNKTQKKKASTLKIVLITIGGTIFAIILGIGVVVHHISSDLTTSSQQTSKVIKEYLKSQDTNSALTTDSLFGQIPSFNVKKEDK